MFANIKDKNMLDEKIFEENDCRIIIGSIEKKLANNINLQIPNIKSKKRQAEKITTKILLHKLEPKLSLSYNDHGAPSIKEKHISIAHSNELATIIISKKKVGIDIEKISSKAKKLSSKFTIKNINEEEATLIWCAKEAIYKWHSKGNIDFIKDISIAPFKTKKSGVLKVYFKNFQHTLYYKKIYKHFLVYVCS